MNHVITTALLLLLAAVPASPQGAADGDSIHRRFNLDNIVVTGTRTPKLLKDTPIQTRLITSADLAKIGAADVCDLLQQELPGVEFSFAMDQQTSINFAGFAGQGVLILVDGERLAGETMDNVDFSRLNLDNVDRIEIVKGAASALYGSNATGGVVNIITRDATQPWALNLNTRFGAHGELRCGGTLSLAGRHVGNTLSVCHTTIDAYDVCRDASDPCDFRTVYGSTTWSFADKFTVRPADGMKLTARAGYFFRQRDYNADAPDRYRDFSGGLRGEWDITPADHVELSYSFDQYDKSDYIRQYSYDVRDYSNVQHAFRAVYSRRLRSADVLTVGGDFLRDYLQTYQFADGGSRCQNTADLFLQYDLALGRRWEIVGAGRWDYFSNGNDSHATAKLAFRYNGGRLTVRGGYAGGFRAPSLKEKFMDFDMQGIFDIRGNRQLAAEKSHNFNLSAEYTAGSYNFMAAGSYNLLDNKIATSAVLHDANGSPFLQYINVGDLSVFGFEAAAQARWSNGLSARIAYNYTHEEAVGPSSSAQYCPARPHTLNCRFSWGRQWSRRYATEVVVSGRLLSAVDYVATVAEEPFVASEVSCPAYTMWKLQLSQTVGSGVRLTAAVDNIFNYVPSTFRFNSPVTLGATLSVGMSVDVDRIL